MTWAEKKARETIDALDMRRDQNAYFLVLGAIHYAITEAARRCVVVENASHSYVEDMTKASRAARQCARSIRAMAEETEDKP